jgi:hypothetical protein
MRHHEVTGPVIVSLRAMNPSSVRVCGGLV